MTIFTFSKVDTDGKILAFWDPEIGDKYEDDCAKGRFYADEVVEKMISDSNPAILGWVVRGFGQNEARRGVETGFCHRISERLLGQN